MSAEAPKFSFTFSKRKKPILQAPASAQKHETQVNKKEIREYITAIEDNVIHSTKPAPTQLVIPLIHSKHGIRSRMQAATRSATSTTDALTQQALEELAAEARGDSGPDAKANLRIQLPNALVDSDVSEEVNYEAIPVESFGLAALTGMGFNPEDLKSATGQPVGPIRPKGLGLGADPRVLQTPKPEENDESKKKLEWTTGAHCQAVLGKYKGKYGTVNGMDGDTGRVIVKFTISKEIASVLQPMLRLVPEKEYNKYANCLNQSEVDCYKAEEEQLQQQEAVDPYKSFSSYNDRFPYNKIERDSYVPHHKPSHQPKSQDPYSWVRPKLLVRLLDRHYLNGRYYRQKVTVTKVDSGLCTCVTRSGEVLEGIHPKHLKTVIPECNNTMVMILHGPRNGEMAKLMERHLETNEVDLRTRAGTMISLRYDQICMVSD